MEILFELQETGQISGKPVFESVEEAFERYLCDIAKIERKKEERVVEVIIKSGSEDIKSTTRVSCLPKPGYEIMQVAEKIINSEADISYRKGYVQGYKDRDAKKPMSEIFDIPENSKTYENIRELQTTLENHFTLIDIVEQITDIFNQALSAKRDMSYKNGYWQGYQDKSGNVLPKFHFFENPNEDVNKVKW